MAGVPSYVAFLRAINLGAVRKFPKDDIRRAVESAGCTGVETHINTGNVLLRSGMRTREKVEQALEEVFLADRGFEVPTIVFTLAELAGLVAEADRLAVGNAAGSPAGSSARHYLTLLKRKAGPEAAGVVEALTYDGERACVSGRAVHVFLSGTAYHSAKLGNAKIEKLLGVATTRDVKVIRAVAAKWA
jgi:uncharacterized protein (DUF1697 family)